MTTEAGYHHFRKFIKRSWRPVSHIDQENV